MSVNPLLCKACGEINDIGDITEDNHMHCKCGAIYEVSPQVTAAAHPTLSTGLLKRLFGGDINWLCCPVGGIKPNRTSNRRGRRFLRRTQPLELGLEQRSR